MTEWQNSERGPLDLLVLDTLHNSAYGMEENSARDVGRILAVAKQARETLGCTILFVHHAGKAGNYRGSSVMHGSMDTMLEVESNELMGIMRTFKLKDAEKPPPAYFRLYKDEVGGSAWVDWLTNEASLSVTKPKAQDIARDAIRRLLSEKPQLNQTEIVTELAGPVGETAIRNALKEMEEAGMFEVERGAKNSKIYRLIEQYKMDL